MATGCSDSTLPHPTGGGIAVVGEIDQAPMNNDFDVPEYVADLREYCGTLRAAGFRVIIMTNPYRRDYYANSVDDEITFDRYLVDINDSIRLNWPTFADGIADMKPLEKYNQLYDQIDRLNFTGAGYTVMSNIVFNAIKKL